MSSIDNRIVQMKFDNRGFESGAKQSMKTLDSLDSTIQKMDGKSALSGLSKTLSSLGQNELSGLTRGIDSVNSKLSTMGVAWMTAISRITNGAISAGKRMVSALTIEPIMSGFQEYELKMNSIQTILTNTAHRGTTLKDVTRALDELNTYADKTIYNFAEMTRNIGTFTAAGVDLETAVSSIKGIANLAAGSGSSPAQAASAMYQLSQAIAAGKVNLMDWNSVVNAGMGGKLFQDALVKTAEGMGKVIDKGKPFRETLQDGWLTADVLTKTLSQFAEDESLIKAATEVKTFTGMIDTMKESVQSSWAQTWEAIIGDKEQAAELFTSINDSFSNFINGISESRNKMFSEWNANGGRDAFLKGFANIFGSIGKIGSSIGEAFRDIFPPMTGKQLKEISVAFENLTEKFKISDATAEKLKDTFRGLFSAVDVFLGIIKSGVGAVGDFFGNIMDGAGPSLVNGILNITSAIGNALSAIRDGINTSGLFDNVSSGISNALTGILKLVGNFGTAVGNAIKGIASADWSGVISGLSEVGEGINKVFSGIGTMLSKVDLGKVFGAIAAIFTAKQLGTVKDIGDTLRDTVDSFVSLAREGTGIKDSIVGMIDGVKDALQAYQNDLQAGTLMKIAIAIGIMAASLMALSTISMDDMTTGLSGITILLGELVGAFAILMKVSASSGNLLGVFKISSALLALSSSLLIMSFALKNISDMDPVSVATALAGLAGSLIILIAGVKALEGSTKGLTKTATGLILLSVALYGMSKAVASMGSLDVASLAKGLAGLAVVLGSLALFMNTSTGSISVGKATGILILASALNVMAMAIKSIGSLNVSDIAKGLTGIAVVLGTISLFTKTLNTGGSVNLMLTATSLVTLGVAINIFGAALIKMGSVSIGTIGTGLLGLASALVVMGVAAKAIPTTSLLGMSVGISAMAISLSLLASALNKMSGMSWSEVGVGLATLAGSLTILAVAMKAMSGGLMGAVALSAMALSISLLVPSIVALSALDITGVVTGLTALAGVFGVIGLAGLLLGPMVPALLGLAGAVALFGAGCMAAGVGIGLFATGLGLLVTVVTAGIAGLTQAFINASASIPTIIQNLTLGITTFFNSISQMIPGIITAITGALTAIATSIAQAIPKLASAAMQIITALGNALISYMPKLITIGSNVIVAFINGLTQNVPKIVTAAINMIVTFANTLSSNLGPIVNAAITLAISFVNALANGIRQNSGAIRGAAMNLITACIGVITGALGQFVSKGAEMVMRLVNGIKSRISSATSAMRNVVSQAANAAKSGVSKFFSIGSQMISGLVNGIKSMASRVASAAKSVVTGAINAAKRALDINSPSRVMMEIGKFTVEGFAKGLDDNVGMSNKSSERMANGAISAINNSIGMIKDIVDSDIDMKPTITPVLDLSNIQKGSSVINDLLPNGSIGVETSSMAKTIGRVQNGDTNLDLLKELKAIKSGLSDINSTSYVIDGITYDDGSNITQAVESLIHAVNIERRI